MKNFMVLCTLLSIVLSCNKEEKLLEAIAENRIISMTVEKDNGETFNNWTEEFEYNDLGKLISVRQHNRSSNVEFSYNADNVLFEIAEYKTADNALRTRDSLVHDNNDLLIKIYSFNSANDLIRTIEYTHDASGRVIEKKNQRAGSIDYSSIQRYFWTGENIERMEQTIDDEVTLVKIFEFDSKANYKRNNPLFVKDPLNSTLNNVTKDESSGSSLAFISANCFSCKHKYNYNGRELPKKIKLGWGGSIELEYE